MSNSEIRMYGVTVEQLREDVEDSLTFKFSGATMVAMSLMSDVQELLQYNNNNDYTREVVRQTLNRAKWVLSTYVMEK